jgi:hypothetical protein
MLLLSTDDIVSLVELKSASADFQIWPYSVIFEGMGWVSFACASWRTHQANT